MNRVVLLTPSLSPSEGKRVSVGRERGLSGRWRAAVGGLDLAGACLFSERFNINSNRHRCRIRQRELPDIGERKTKIENT
jgi:hypothetical protein